MFETERQRVLDLRKEWVAMVKIAESVVKEIELQTSRHMLKLRDHDLQFTWTREELEAKNRILLQFL